MKIKIRIEMEIEILKLYLVWYEKKKELNLYLVWDLKWNKENNLIWTY